MDENVKRQHRSLFIVEEDLFLRKLYDAKFRKLGYENVYFAESGDEAEVLLDGDLVPDVLVLDLLMDDNRGVKILKKVKTDARFCDVSVIALSGSGQEDVLKRGLLLGVNDYLIKSDASLDDVIDKVEKYL